MEHNSLTKLLLDANNREHLTMMDETGKGYTFEQVAVIPYEDNLYCILKPLDDIKGIAPDEAIVFRVSEDEYGNEAIRIEEDNETAKAVFDRYYELLKRAKEEGGDKK